MVLTRKLYMNEYRNESNLTGSFLHEAENFALIDGYEKYQEKFRDSPVNSKTVWNDISNYVNENCDTMFTACQCSKRWNYLRRQYGERIQYSCRTGRSAKAAKWPFWDRMNSVLGNDTSVVPLVIAGSRGVRRPSLQAQESFVIFAPENSDEDSISATSKTSVASANSSQLSLSLSPTTSSRRSFTQSGSRLKRARMSRQDVFLTEIRRMHDEKMETFKAAEAAKCALLNKLLEHLDKSAKN